MANDETLRPSSEEFVVRMSPADQATVARVRRLGPVERLAGSPGLCLVRLPQRETAAQSWAAAAKAIGGNVEVFPVLYDRDGAAHYPTGEVTVRFTDAPSDSDLARFCDSNRLRLLRRNAFVAAQVVCAPASATSDFLPDLVAHVASQPGVHRAWANTLSAYRRAKK